LIIIVITYCCKTEEPEYPVPDAVIMVAKSPDTSGVERGIDAVPESQGIQLQWYKITDRNIIHYNIYRKQDKTDSYFKKIAERRVDFTQPSDLDTMFTDTANVELYKDYFYYVTASNKDNKEGPPSDTVSYRLLPKVNIQYPKGQQISQTRPEFVWNMDQEKPHQYILRIKEETSNELFFVAYIVSNYTNEPEIVNLNDFEPLDLDDFDPGIYYYWRVDCVGDELPRPSGSESNWELFSVSDMYK
jgi:hypothetical protein